MVDQPSEQRVASVHGAHHAADRRAAGLRASVRQDCRPHDSHRHRRAGTPDRRPGTAPGRLREGRPRHRAPPRFPPARPDRDGRDPAAPRPPGAPRHLRPGRARTAALAGPEADRMERLRLAGRDSPAPARADGAPADVHALRVRATDPRVPEGQRGVRPVRRPGARRARAAAVAGARGPFERRPREAPLVRTAVGRDGCSRSSTCAASSRSSGGRAASGCGTSRSAGTRTPRSSRPTRRSAPSRTRRFRTTGVRLERGAWVAHPDAKDGQVPDRARLLSPFDRLVHDRDRAEALWGFRYRLEMYVPAAKREYGYYVLPLLVGDSVVGRAEPRFDRKTGKARAARRVGRHVAARRGPRRARRIPRRGALRPLELGCN